MLKGFKEFAMRGNVMDMAVGILIGVAFGGIVTSFVQDILTPPLGLLLGGLDFTNLFITLAGATHPTLAEAQAAGAVTINYGVFLTTVFNFVIVAFAVFLMIGQLNRLKAAPPPPAAAQKQCPECLSTIAIGAKRCPFCTQMLTP